MPEDVRDNIAAPDTDGMLVPFAELAAADASQTESDLRHMLHELRQPLNNIQLATILLRNRTAPLLEGKDHEYFMRRIERIEGQVARAVEIANRISKRA